MKQSDKAILRECAALTVSFGAILAAMLFLWGRLTPEGLAAGALCLFGMVFASMALGDVTRAALDREAAGRHWGEALWRAVWGAELFAILVLAYPLVKGMSAARLLLLLTGFYVQTKGTFALAHTLKARPLQGGRDLFVGLVAMSAALLLRS